MKRDSDKISAELAQTVERVIVQLAMNIQNRLIIETPVDTGFARSNWVASVGEFQSGTALSSQHSSGGGATLRREVFFPRPEDSIAFAALDYKLMQGPIYIVNNVAYIERLNEGHSAQAPAGFVDRIAIQEVDKLRNKKLDGFTVTLRKS